MDNLELTAHHLLNRLKYLLARLEGEFFHVHPDMEINGSTTSLAFSSILNEALNLHEASFPDDNFWPAIKKWGKSQDWNWNEVKIRFTYWHVLRELHPFKIDSQGRLTIAGRDENNSVKHHGELATLSVTVEACATAWFIVLEKAREAEVFLTDSDIDELKKLFDCYNLIGRQGGSYGTVISRPLVNKLEYPAVRGRSEVHGAEAAFKKRASNYTR
jgi:hypothetical protein